MGCPNEGALVRVCPAVDGADNVATRIETLGIQVAAVFEDDGLSMSADVGEQFNALRGSNQYSSLTLVIEGLVISDFGNT